MATLLVNFVRTGAPGAVPGAAAWRAYTIDAPISLRLDTAAPAAGSVMGASVVSGGGLNLTLEVDAHASVVSGGGLNLTLEVDAHATQCAFWDEHPMFDQESVSRWKTKSV
jgi:hypothetical protein